MKRIEAQFAPLAVLLIFFCFLATAPSPSTADSPANEHAKLFEEQIRPLLANRCFACHGPDKQRGGLRLDSRAGMLAGGESGPSITPGHPDQSLLIEAIRWQSYEMPPDGKLADGEIETITQWVKNGAVWLGASGQLRPVVAEGSKLTDEDRNYWAFQPIRDPEVPVVGNAMWPRNEIDCFILRRLEQESISPAASAEPRALVRRLYFDLVGLPPRPEVADAFAAEPSDEAYRRMVDELLDSPQYGERWARHWLDLVRYAESDGYRQDAYRPDAWRYRDYVIRAFNDDKPYDRFVTEQLAGDELDPHDLDCLAATAFLRHWVYEYNQRDVRTQWDNILTDITNVTGDVFLGLGMGCARCHDHKFDPILREDYFRLKAFFTPLLPTEETPYANQEQWEEFQQRQAAWEDATAEVRAQIATLEKPYIDEAIRRAAEKFPPDIRPMIQKPVEQRSPFEHQLAELAWRQAKAEVAKINFASKLAGEEKATWQRLQAELVEFDELKPAALPSALTVTDVGPVSPPTRIPKSRDGRDIAPGFLTVLDPADAVIPSVGAKTTGRRTALAKWLASPENPLTARVIVNRIWQQHFGRGLVATPSDFGHLGQPPTHPELLDWLASRFIEDGWRLKALHRRIVTSATYRQSAMGVRSEIASRKDPENLWLWRMNVHRLDAEQIRDAMLHASGELEADTGGPSVESTRPRRSIYCKLIRNRRDPVLAAFDAADGFSSTDRRNVTTTPIQALTMINSPWSLTRAHAMAARLQQASLRDDESLVAQAYRWAYGRSPTVQETKAAAKFLRQEREAAASHDEGTAMGMAAMPDRGSMAADLHPGANFRRLSLTNRPALPDEDFTIEAIIYLRSLYPDATVRTIASHWDSNNSHPGWALGVTSTKSAYQPRNLILQLVSDPAQGGTGYEVIASNLRPEMNKPYYVAVSVRMADASETGVTFYMKDLSRPAAELLSASAEHKAVAHCRSTNAFVLGGRDGSNRHQWDGLIDDVRLSRRSLRADELTIAGAEASSATVAHWTFDDETQPLADLSSQGNHLDVSDGTALDPASVALVDFCHVLLNSNEFIYVD